MTISDILKYVREWWWILIVVPGLTAGAGYGLSSSMTPIYSANATLLVESRQSVPSTEYSDILASERLTRTISQLAMGRSILQETIEREDLPFTVSELSRNVAVIPVRDTQLIRVAVEDTDPDRAARTANTLAAVLIERLANTQQAANIIGRSEIEADLRRLSEQIDETTALVAEVRSRPDQDSAPTAAELRRLESLLSHYERTFVSLLEIEQGLILGAAQLTAGVSVAEPATASSSPISPRIAMITALSTILGMLLAGGLVVLMGYVDDTVKSAQDVALVTGRPAIGAIPTQAVNGKLVTVESPRSIATEAFRGLRTNLQFASLDRSLRSFIVTSVKPEDGKTTTAANLAVVLAQGGQRVILIDADLRKPRIQSLFSGVSNREGLSSISLMAKNAPLEDFLQSTSIPRLRVLATGPLPSNPPDLLNSSRIGDLLSEAEQLADIVVIDSPPLAVSDALAMSRWTDGVVLVAASGKTRRSELALAQQRIAQVGSEFLGVVLNHVEVRSDDVYDYYGYGEPEQTERSQAAPEQRGRIAGSRVGGSLFSRRSRT